MNGNKSIAMQCFLTGIGTGIALTLLFAPLSGAEARKLIARKVKDGEDWVRDQTADAGEFVAAQADGLRDRVKKVGEAVLGG